MPDEEWTLGKPPIVPDSCSRVDDAERNKKLEAQAMQQNPNTMGYGYLSSLQQPTCTHYTKMMTCQLTGVTPWPWTLRMWDSALKESSLTQMWRVPLQSLSWPEIVQGSTLPTELSCLDIGGKPDHDLFHDDNLNLTLQPNGEEWDWAWPPRRGLTIHLLILTYLRSRKIVNQAPWEGVWTGLPLAWICLHNIQFWMVHFDRYFWVTSTCPKYCLFAYWSIKNNLRWVEEDFDNCSIDYLQGDFPNISHYTVNWDLLSPGQCPLAGISTSFWKNVC